MAVCGSSSDLAVQPLPVGEGEQILGQASEAKLAPHQSSTHCSVTGGKRERRGNSFVSYLGLPSLHEFTAAPPVCVPCLHDDLL